MDVKLFQIKAISAAAAFWVDTLKEKYTKMVQFSHSKLNRQGGSVL